ncbi:MAG: AAA family ATPase [Bacteroidia bacterium]|nr:AAA family ATPase [Bacteroidia bacterium]
MKNNENYKFRDIKTYGSTEWLANNAKKYRSIFDELEVSYIYCEFSFFNKKFDEDNWDIKLLIKCLDSSDNEVCELNCDRQVDKRDNVVYVREGWGVKTPNTYWKAGSYRWEVWVNGELIGTKSFFIERQGIVKNGTNPYFTVETLKLYEGPDANLNPGERKYYIAFNALSTRYIWIEFNAKNLVRKSTDWACELTFNYKTASGHLKGSVTKLFFIKPEEDHFSATIGWGSDMLGTWGRGRYYIETVFMDELVASVPFEVGDDYMEAEEGDFLPLVQSGFYFDEDFDIDDKDEVKTPENNGKAAVQPDSYENVMGELDQLIGLDSIKNKIREYSNYLKFITLRKEKGLADDEKVSLHAVFKGNPGTGKTTVARLLGRIYKEMGLLKKGHVHEVDRGDLVAEFIGQTAPKTKEAIKKAKDGILFIDEAYSLARKDDDSKDFGKEAIEILLKELSDSTDIAIIVAGYPAEMDIFMESNPGLKSRFTMTYDFPDYVPQELLQIAEFAAEKRGVKIGEGAKDITYKQLVDAYRNRDKFFGNARLVNSLIDEFKMNLGLRIMKTNHPEQLTNEALSTIEKEDVEKAFLSHIGIVPDIPVDEELLKESTTKLKSMIGLQSVKHDVDELVKLVRFYKETGKNPRQIFSLHSVFLGNPGTGKTTVARILAQIYKALGILERGHLVECDRQSLVGGYIGQTAIKTAELIDKAMGGVLFIDEAYALTEGGGSDYGKEAIETLLKRMEDNRGKFIVIAAGYTQNMERFLEANPGLKSRFDRIFTFEDFKPEELVEIAINQLKDNNIFPDEAAKENLTTYIKYMYEKRDKFFGNGRAVRKVIEEAIRNQHLRLSEIPKAKRTQKVISTLTVDDLSEFKADNIPTHRAGIGFRVG